jgi:hypothetical protein
MTTSFKLSVCNECDAFFCVSVSDDVAEMRAAVEAETGYVNEKMTGVCIRDYALSDGNMGWIFFAKDHIGAGYVCHELAHAAFRVCEYHDIVVNHTIDDVDENGERTSVDNSEERYCQILEFINAAFWREAYERGLAVATTSRPS